MNSKLTLRVLQLRTLNEVSEEVLGLQRNGYLRCGNWTLGQACQHLRLAQEMSIDGYPSWMSWFAFLRPITKRLLLPKALSADPPRGIRTFNLLQPSDTADDDHEVDLFLASIKRFREYAGDFHAHPAFGKLPRAELEAVHAAHAAHHLRFLEPKDG